MTIFLAENGRGSGHKPGTYGRSGGKDRMRYEKSIFDRFRQFRNRSDGGFGFLWGHRREYPEDRILQPILPDAAHGRDGSVPDRWCRRSLIIPGFRQRAHCGHSAYERAFQRKGYHYRTLGDCRRLFAKTPADLSERISGEGAGGFPEKDRAGCALQSAILRHGGHSGIRRCTYEDGGSDRIYLRRQCLPDRRP